MKEVKFEERIEDSPEAARYGLIDEERTLLMGYSLKELCSELDFVPSSLHCTVSDILRGGYGIAYELLELTIFKRKLQAALIDWRHVHAHR